MNKLKLKGFTLAEMIVSMALTLILVSLSYLVFNQVLKKFNDYNKHQSFISRLNLFDKAMHHFFDASKIIYLNDDELLFESPEENIKVILKNDYVIIEKQDFTDTIFLKKKEIKTDFLSLNDKRFLENLHITFDYENEKFSLSYNKQYDAESILKVLKNE